MAQNRLSILKNILSKSNDDFSYSSMLRKIRKEHPEKLHEFMKNFKEAFDAARNGDLDAVEKISLLQAIKLFNKTK